MVEKNIFFLNKVFPEPDKIFSENFKSASEIISDAIIVLDTNVLLVPFDTNEKNVKDIKSIYLKYKNEGRLYIPARVAREFANNRANKIGDVFLQIRQLKDNLNSGYFKINQYPILENNKDYKKIIEIFSSIQKEIKESRKRLDNVENHIKSWTWNDSISIAYKEIFTPEVIIEVQKPHKELEEELAFRIEYKVAPGFKDSKKIDDGIGDFEIWQTLLEIAKNQGKDIIFVTNDQKNDWFYKQDKIGLYPKYELFDEFRRYTGGKSIAIIDFVRFLELSNMNAKTIKEISSSINDYKSDGYQLNISGLTIGSQVEHQTFGFGKVVKMRKSGNDDVAQVFFINSGIKNLLVRFAPLKVIDSEFDLFVNDNDMSELTKTNEE